MRVDLQLCGLCLALALSASAHGQSFSFTPAGGSAGAAPVAQPQTMQAPTQGTTKGPATAAPGVSVLPAQDLSATPNLAAMLATMSTKAPTISLLSDLQRREREVAVADRLGKLKAATAPPTPAEGSVPVKVIRPKIREPLVAEEAPLKRVLAIYGARGKEEADLLMPDGSIETVRKGMRMNNFEVVSLSTDALKVNVSRQVVAKVADGVRNKSQREELRTVHSTIEVPVGTAFH